MDFFVAYTADGGGGVFVKRSMDPFRELGISPDASPQQVKWAYSARANRPRRQDRVTAALAYHMITSAAEGRYSRRGREYEIKNGYDQFFLAAVGYTARLLSVVQQSSLFQADEGGQTSLYIAARCGFYDTCKALLEAGAPIDQVQKDGSTPLHGAAYYAQVPVVKLLLSYGANPHIKNRWGNTASDETGSKRIRKLVLEYKEDKIAQFAREFISAGLATKISSVKDKNGVEIARKIIRNHEATRSREWEEKLASWESCWHGTRCRFLKSILQHGLVPSGSKAGDLTVTPHIGHIPLGTDCMGKKDWAAAIFVSPSLLYASDQVYADLLMSGGENWRVVVRVRVEPGSYTEHESTLVSEYAKIFNDEPEYRVESNEELVSGHAVIAEYRIKSNKDDTVQRIERARHVIVTSIVFVRASFLEQVTASQNITYTELLEYFGDV